MILPVTVYGNPILRKKAVNIDADYKDLNKLIEDMWETMYHTDGVGLAAPQINRSIRLFVIDATPFAEDDPSVEGFKKVFINAQITDYGDEEIGFNEGCLSVPNLNEDVYRPTSITITYQDENFETFTETFEGLRARVIQHEYDHIEGKLFIDRISPIRRRLIKGKLAAIEKHKTMPRYKIVRNK